MKRVLKTVAVTLIACMIIGTGAGCMSAEPSYYRPIDSYTDDQGEYTPNYVYDSVVEQPFVSTDKSIVSTVSLDCNTSSYTLMKNQIMSGLRVAPDSVRLEEYINYFEYDYPYPEEGASVAVTTKTFGCPWNEDHRLVSVGVRTDKVEPTAVRNNIVLLLDVSGSMRGETRIELVKKAFAILVTNLTDLDFVSIVTYANTVEKVCDSIACTKGGKSSIINKLNALTANGGTNGSGGIQTAYQCAVNNFIEGGNNRIFIATDGDFNIGVNTTEGLSEMLGNFAESGVYTSIIGVGMGNTNDRIMQSIVKNSNGNAYYISSLSDARKQFVTDILGTLYTVCEDAKFMATFNPLTVKRFRLLGYDTKTISVEQFDDPNADTGEIGSGLTVTVLYEIELQNEAESGARLLTANVSYNDKLNEGARINVLNDATNTLCSDEDSRFIACVAEFALYLRSSAYAPGASIKNVLERLQDLQSIYTNAERAEFYSICQRASAMYQVNLQTDDT